MSTTSPNLNLTLPEVYDNVNVEAHISANFRRIDEKFSQGAGSVLTNKAASPNVALFSNSNTATNGGVILSGGSVGGNTASGGGSCVVSGSSNGATGDHSLAGGGGNTASGTYSVALGGGNNASGMYSAALGGGNNASGGGAFAMGQGNTAGGASSVALGGGNNAGGEYAIAVGGGSRAGGARNVAFNSWLSGGSYNVGFNAYHNSVTGYRNFLVASSGDVDTNDNVMLYASDNTINASSSMVVHSNANRIGGAALLLRSNACTVGSGGGSIISSSSGAVDGGGVAIGGAGGKALGVNGTAIAGGVDTSGGTDAGTGNLVYGGVAIGHEALNRSTESVSFGHLAGESYQYTGTDGNERTVVFTSDRLRQLKRAACATEASDAMTLGQFAGMIGASIEKSSTAAESHPVGAYLIVEGRLRKVTAAINAGDDISELTNVVATTLAQTAGDGDVGSADGEAY